MKKALLVIGAACLFIAGFWFIAIPTSLISGQIEHALHYDDLYARAEGVRKGLLYSFDVGEIRLYRRGSDIPLAVLRDLRMEKSPILQEWRRLNAAGELAGPQKLWFAPHKPDEELYDTAADPDEVNNLAGKPEHAATLKRMRAALDTWMTDIHDLGGVPEEQLIERFWPGHKQPVTATPVIETASDGTVTITCATPSASDGTVRITCATPGASIGYRLGKSKEWHVFAGPFKAKEAVHAKAIRLGYKISKEISQ